MYKYFLNFQALNDYFLCNSLFRPSPQKNYCVPTKKYLRADENFKVGGNKQFYEESALKENIHLTKSICNKKILASSSKLARIL